VNGFCTDDVLPVSKLTVSRQWKNTKHWPKPVAWRHPFFIDHWTSDCRGLDRFDRL